ncbi:hypothetical protein BJ508DRAFT_245125 [Ascobolus immersus RN42]|uniref:Tc1-like transposase DDE domain-containing protein n=1 Tax=Ascobolus immersus RN42 TaxID=1160509 RepID=A0A3N4HC62_ASCIM|nr:hypothetical protein BJ508DRAFT_245125 [Ascobolus immersus RN42]
MPPKSKQQQKMNEKMAKMRQKRHPKVEPVPHLDPEPAELTASPNEPPPVAPMETVWDVMEMEEQHRRGRAIVHWDVGADEDGEEDESDLETSEAEDMDPEDAPGTVEDAFARMLQAASNSEVFRNAHFPYQRGVELSERQKRRIRKRQREDLEERESDKPVNKAIKAFFTTAPSRPASEDSAQNTASASAPQPPSQGTGISNSGESSQLPSQPQAPPRKSEFPLSLEDAIARIEVKMKQKKDVLEGQNLLRHRAVCVFMHLRANPPTLHNMFGNQLRKIDLATLSANAFGKGPYLARKIIAWEHAWRHLGIIPEGKQGCHSKSHSWFNDEGVQLAVREYLMSPEAKGGKNVSGHRVAQIVGDYLDSQRVGSAVEEALNDTHDSGLQSVPDSQRTRRIKARTARRWLRVMGLHHHKLMKSVYVNGHERSDVVKYRNEVFLPDWIKYRKRCIVFKEDGTWTLPEGCDKIGENEYRMRDDGTRPLVLVTHDESTVNANDSRRSGWFMKMEDGTFKLPIEPKGKGKGIMVSAFLTPGGILRVPNTISDEQLQVLADDGSSWPLTKEGKPLREAVHYLEYGNGNWWTGDKMVDQTIQEVLPIFKLAFPGCDALFAFDNASNHSSYAADALVAARMNLNPGGANVPKMRDGFVHREKQMGWTQPMQFGDGDPRITMRGLPKGIKQVLSERGLWPGTGRNILGDVFRADCPTSHGRPGCPSDPEDPDTGKVVGKCCARTLLANQKDFRSQRGKLEEMVTARGHKIIFYPKFHCELNFIERYWASVKAYTREHCTYDIQGLRKNLPAAIHSVPVETIYRYYMHCERVIDVYADPENYSYGSKAFQERLAGLKKYSSHRQVRDKTKD